ncbi:MAG TPA: hypothetical protein VHR18_00525 [Solirubrobacterales bacterium]|jgi:hypothetical protein|nr:hypothetical protein [Solirubrobacterales bacterium]
MKPRATKLLIVCGVLLGLAMLTSAAAAAPARSGPAKGSLLYVQETAGGSIEPLGAGAYRLRLTGVSPRVTTFTDRPRRRAGRQGLKGFVGSWKANGFAADPPNAALVLDHAPASHDVALLTLSHPRYDRARQTLTYRVTPLHGDDTALASFARRADPVRAGDLGAASLFVDDGGGALSTVVFDVYGEATTSTVQFLVSGGAAWSLSSVTPLSINGTLPLTSLYATGNVLSLGLPPGSSLASTISIPIEPSGTGAPQVEVTNVSGTITVTWPTDQGPQTQALVAGDPITLSGLAP